MVSRKSSGIGGRAIFRSLVALAILFSVMTLPGAVYGQEIPLEHCDTLPVIQVAAMNWLLKKLGYRDRQYHGTDFSVRIEPMGREAVDVIHARQGARLHLEGQRIGRKWEGIAVYIPRGVEAERASQIARLSEIETVPETERQAAIAELRQMGFEIEVSTDRKQIRQKWIAGTPKPSPETIRKTIPRQMALLQAVHGTRERFEILAKSKEF